MCDNGSLDNNISEKCSEVEEMLFRYIDGNVSCDEMLGVEEHLAVCDKCRRELDSCKKTLSLISESGFQPDATIYSSVMKKIKPAGVNIFVKYASLAAVALLFVAVMLNYKTLTSVFNKASEDLYETAADASSSLSDSAAANDLFIYSENAPNDGETEQSNPEVSAACRMFSVAPTAGKNDGDNMTTTAAPSATAAAPANKAPDTLLYPAPSTAQETSSVTTTAEPDASASGQSLIIAPLKLTMSLSPSPECKALQYIEAFAPELTDEKFIVILTDDEPTISDEAVFKSAGNSDVWAYICSFDDDVYLSITDYLTSRQAEYEQYTSPLSDGENYSYILITELGD